MNLWLRSIHYLLLRKSRFLFVVGPAPFKLSMNKPQGENRPCGQTVFSLLEKLHKKKIFRFLFRHKTFIPLKLIYFYRAQRQPNVNDFCRKKHVKFGKGLRIYPNKPKITFSGFARQTRSLPTESEKLERA